MQKLLAGCLVVLLLCAVGLGVGVYFVYRAASPMVHNARQYLASLSELGELEKDVRNRETYAAPATGELTDAQVERFARVQQQVRAALGQRFDEIEAKYQHLKTDDPSRQPSIGEVMGALRDLLNVFVQARRLQVAALNEHGFSLAEYGWVRDRVYQAAGVELVSGFNLQKLTEAARQGGLDDLELPDRPIRDVPARNRELVKPYVSRIEEWLPLAFFGL